MTCLLCHEHRRHGDDPLCDYCRARVRLALDNAPALYVRAVSMVAARNNALSERVSRPKPGAQSPLDDGLLAACDDLCRSVRRWHDEHAMTTGAPILSAMVRRGYAVQRASHVLAGSLGAAVRIPTGVSRAADVLTVSRRLRDRIGLTPLVHQLAAPCPRCDTRALIRRDGDDQVSCRMCGNAWPERHYELLARVLVDEAADRHEPA